MTREEAIHVLSIAAVEYDKGDWYDQQRYMDPVQCQALEDYFNSIINPGGWRLRADFRHWSIMVGRKFFVTGTPGHGNRGHVLERLP